MEIKLTGPLTGETTVPGDKSITHRAVIFSSLAQGQSIINKPLLGEDCLSTINIFRQLGVHINIKDERIVIDSPGWRAFNEPVQVLDTGNSGTTTRLLAGLMSGLPFRTVLSGDASIGKRPMERVIQPLSMMGAEISGSHQNTRTPLVVEPARLNGLHYEMPVASAQVKSAILLAGLFSEQPVTVIETVPTRNHTEMMLPFYGVHVQTDGYTSTLQPRAVETIRPHDINIPADISSAAFLMVAALVTPGSSVTIKDVGINPTRDGIIEVIKQMGGTIAVEHVQQDGEPSADIHVSYTEQLHPITIEGSMIPRLIDELPIIALLATQASGTTVIKDAEELKVKETNRIDAVVDELNAVGFNLEATADGMIIHPGWHPLKNVADSRGDHRIGMMLAVATLLTGNSIDIKNFDSVNISFPSFLALMTKLGGK